MASADNRLPDEYATLSSLLEALASLPRDTHVSAGADGVRFLPFARESTTAWEPPFSWMGATFDRLVSVDGCRPVHLTLGSTSLHAADIGNVMHSNAIELAGGWTRAGLVYDALSMWATTHPDAVMCIDGCQIVLPIVYGMSLSRGNTATFATAKRPVVPQPLPTTALPTTAIDDCIVSSDSRPLSLSA